MLFNQSDSAEMWVYLISHTWSSSSFSLKMGRLSLCCTMESSVFFPYDTWFPPKAFLFHSGRWTGMAPMPLMLAAICLPSSGKEQRFGNIVKFRPPIIYYLIQSRWAAMIMNFPTSYFCIKLWVRGSNQGWEELVKPLISLRALEVTVHYNCACQGS